MTKIIDPMIQKIRNTVLCTILLLISACAALPPANLGISDRGGLSPCPSSPNCVQSFDAKDQNHYVQPIKFIGTPTQAKKNLLDALNSTPDTVIVVVESNYVRAECTSKWLGFIDDIEFLIDKQEIHVRSASRTGYYDLGVNLKRVKTIREKILN